jgi:hypothetical protein
VSVVATALRELMALGVTGDALVAAIERIEEAATIERTASVREAVNMASAKADRDLADRKARAAERTRKWREKANKPDRDVTERHGDACDAPPTRSARVVTPFSSSLRSEEVGGGGGERASEPADDWPDGKATDHVRLLVAQVASPRLDPSKSPGLVTTAGRLVAWRKEGASWEHDVVPVVTALCAKQRSPVSTWKFFDQAIGRSIADNRAALEIPDARVVRLHPTGPPSFVDKLAAERAEARRKALEDG